MPSDTGDFVYRNAPLIEVIVEARWRLVRLTAIPGGAVDPHFERAIPGVLKQADEIGLRHVERIVPEGVPLEMMPGQVIFRVRPGLDRWPLLQFGPGVMTCNAVAPYGGWAEFRQFLRHGISTVLKGYAAADGQISMETFALRYVNAFTAEHGYSRDADFLSQALGLDLQIKPGVLANLKDAGLDRKLQTEITAALDEPAGSSLLIKAANGLVKNEPACILELAVNGPAEKHSADFEHWFDAARARIRSTFEAMISDHLRERIGPREAL